MGCLSLLLSSKIPLHQMRMMHLPRAAGCVYNLNENQNLESRPLRDSLLQARTRSDHHRNSSTLTIHSFPRAGSTLRIRHQPKCPCKYSWSMRENEWRRCAQSCVRLDRWGGAEPDPSGPHGLFFFFPSSILQQNHLP